MTEHDKLAEAREALRPDAEALRDIRDHFRNVTPDKLLFTISDGSGTAARYTHAVVAASVALALSRMEWQDAEIARLKAEHRDYQARRGAEVGALRKELSAARAQGAAEAFERAARKLEDAARHEFANDMAAAIRALASEAAK